MVATRSSRFQVASSSRKARVTRVTVDETAGAYPRGAIATGTCELCSNRSTFDDTLTWPSGPSWPEPTTINAASRRLASSRIAAGTERAVTQMADDCTSG